MNRRPRSAAVPLILLLVIALAAGMLMGAARAKADPPANHGQDRGVPPGVVVVPPVPPVPADPANPGQDHGTQPGGAAVLPLPDFVTPDLDGVDKVKVPSTKKPPKNVKFDGEPMPGGVTSGTGTAGAGTGEVLVPGVPGYTWRDGCGPTAVGMVVGYYDGKGWDQLIPGDGTTNSAAAQQVIASHGTAAAPGHYDDYSLPMETTYSTAPDKSELPVGDEHPADSVADFMHTSWSADGLGYGYSYSNMVGPAFTGYVGLKYPGSSPTVTQYGGANLTWTLVKQEINAGRPMVFLVDCDGDGNTDHFVTIVGYREVNGSPEYGCWDTWDTNLLRWQTFRPVSSSYQWGVWSGYSLKIDGTVTPPPSPAPTPTPTSPAIVDTTAPLTTALGLDTLWHNTSVTVTFSATDTQSGVAYTEYSLDGGAWTRGTSVAIAVPRKSSVATVHTLAYRSADVAGNVEATHSAQVKIDTTKPVTTSNATGVTQKGSFSLALTPTDTGSGVAATRYSVDGGAYQVGTSVLITGAGRHTVKFNSSDGAGNVESTSSASVRIN